MQWSWSVFATYLVDRSFLAAAWSTIWVAIVAQAIGIAIGTVIALGLLSRRRWLGALAYSYVWLWRGTPLLIQLLLIYFGLPQLGLRLDVVAAGLVGLSLYAAAYMAEIIRSAIQSIDRGQEEAARAVGMGRAQAMTWIILPQAARLIVPPLGNEFNSMLRTTSLLSVISFEELLRVTTVAISDTFRPVELYAVAALYYLAMTTAWTGIQALIEQRLAVGQTPHRARGGFLTRIFGWRAPERVSGLGT
jgi:polar amino acid transport system permease protein